MKQVESFKYITYKEQSNRQENPGWNGHYLKYKYMRKTRYCRSDKQYIN